MVTEVGRCHGLRPVKCLCMEDVSVIYLVRFITCISENLNYNISGNKTEAQPSITKTVHCMRIRCVVLQIQNLARLSIQAKRFLRKAFSI